MTKLPNPYRASGCRAGNADSWLKSFTPRRAFCYSLVANLILLPLSSWSAFQDYVGILLLAIDFAGMALLFLIGFPVFLPDGDFTLIDAWNVFVLAAGSVLFWTLLAAIIQHRYSQQEFSDLRLCSNCGRENAYTTRVCPRCMLSLIHI